MKYSLAVLGLGLLVAPAGCGDDSSAGQLDAAAHVDANGRPDAGDPCDFHEGDDPGNDTAGEPTGLTLTAEVRICGQIDARAPGEGDVVDTDIFSFEIGVDGPVLVRVVAPDGETLAALQGTLADGALTAIDGSTLRGAHAAFAVDTTTGGYAVIVTGINPTTPGAAVPYQIRVSSDAPDTRCAVVTGGASYTEQHDGATGVDNDVIEVQFAPGVSAALTASPADAPEPSGPALTVSAGMNYQADGASVVNAAEAVDDYVDRDTYVVAAGSETNELSIRVAWSDDGATDFDFFLFPVVGAGETPVPLAGATSSDTAGAEFETTAVLPSTTYWLWVGSYDGSVVPSDYTVTLCGATFTP
jgi:hypothetical protein